MNLLRMIVSDYVLLLTNLQLLPKPDTVFVSLVVRDVAFFCIPLQVLM